MAVDMFIKLDGAPGESKDKGHANEIDVVSWSWGMAQSGSRHLGGGGGSGKVDVSDLSIIKYVDSATPNLMLFCCNGKHISSALLTIRKAGGDNQLEYLKIKMTDCLVTAVSGGANASDDRQTESVTLNFAKVEVDYTPQKPDGTADSVKHMGWSISENVSA
jgi:type VI secretion system secreted protein Hcp